MKKIFYLLLILILTGCTNQFSEQKVIQKDTWSGKIIRFGYEGHDYIWFEKGKTNGKNSGVVHDPDCWCHSKEK